MSARFIRWAFWVGPIKWILICTLIAYICTSFAYAQTSVVMTLGSRHLDGGSYCEFNPGIGLEYPVAVFGVYKNSLCRASAYLGARYQPWTYRSWRFGFLAMGVTGYEDPITLGAGMAFSYEPSNGLGWNLIWVPNKSGEFHNGVIAAQIKRRF